MAKPAIQRYFAGLSTNTLLLALASLFADISTEMLYPVLPDYLTQTLKASGSVVGLVEGVATATQNITQGVSGWLSDTLHKRKPIALIGYIVAALAKPLIGVSPIWQGVMGARFLDRLGTGTRSAPRDALIAASADDDNRGRAFGLEGIGDNLGAFAGPLCAIFLLASLQLDLRLIFYLAVIPGLLAVCMIALVKEKPSVDGAKSKLDIGVRRLPKAYWKYLLVTSVFGIGNSSSSFLILETRDVGVSLEQTILIYSGYNLVAALISYPSGALSDKLGRENVLLSAFAIFLVIYLGFALTRSTTLIAFLFILYGLFQGIFRAVGKAIATDFVPESLRAGGVGSYAMTVGLSGLVASVAAGQLWDNVSHSAVFLYGAVFAVTGGIALLLLIPSEHKKPND